MKKFEIGVFKCGSLELVEKHVVEAKNVDDARQLGIIRYQKAGCFVGAQKI